MGLKKYKAKRKFSQTPEPAGAHNRRASRAPLFVIQKHAARRLHYDLRFEMEGVLKSWAVPKGLPLGRNDKRLAIHVEDHPFDYATFEGIIPAGNYGAGTVMVWDIGTYEVEGGDPVKALRDGRIHFHLHGKKLKGGWSLIRMRPRNGEDKEQWLVLKRGDDMKRLSTRREDSSALTQRSMKRIATGEETIAGTAIENEIDEAKSEKPAFIAPMKALLVKKVTNEDEWIFEIKFDGMRAIAVKDAGKTHLFSRSHRDVTGQFPPIVHAMGKLHCRAGVFDGEIVALDEAGRPSFQLLQPFMQGRGRKARPPVFYYLFDVLNFEAKNIRDVPVEERKQLLHSLLSTKPEALRFSANLEGKLKRLLKEVRRQGLEGLIAKRRGSAYEPDRRSGAWMKLKALQEQEFVIGGYTEPKGGRTHFGALLVGYYEGKKLRFATKVGTGFDEALLKSLHGRFQSWRRESSPFEDCPHKDAAWLEPKLVCQIRFNEWTHGGGLRQPVFIGLRDDKKPTEVKRERPVSAA